MELGAELAALGPAALPALRHLALRACSGLGSSGLHLLLAGTALPGNPWLKLHVEVEVDELDEAYRNAPLPVVDAEPRQGAGVWGGGTDKSSTVMRRAAAALPAGLGGRVRVDTLRGDFGKGGWAGVGEVLMACAGAPEEDLE